MPASYFLNISSVITTTITADIDDSIENILDEKDAIVDGDDFAIASLSKMIC